MWVKYTLKLTSGNQDNNNSHLSRHFTVTYGASSKDDRHCTVHAIHATHATCLKCAQTWREA